MTDAAGGFRPAPAPAGKAAQSGAAASEPGPVLPSPVMVGRRTELGWLGAALARVRAGAPAALLIGGDAGAGKSRLISEFAKDAAASARVLTGRCAELGEIGMPFAPFVAIVRELARRGELAEPAGAGGCELPRWLPGSGPLADGGSSREARARLFVEVLSLLEQLARQQPVVLVIEDAHWAGASTAELLSFLIDSQQAMDGVLIVVTYRSDELHRGHPLKPLLSGLGRIGWVQRAELPGLSRGESAELVRRLLGREPPPSLAGRVHRRAEGNPLLTEELVCHGERSGRAGTAAARDLMLTAIRRLPDDTQEVLRTASARGQGTGRRLLRTVTGMGAAALDACLAPAVASGILAADDDVCAFRHALISDALHQDLLPCEHGEAHQRFAAALGQDPSLVPAGYAAIEQAEHWHHVHDPARALASAWQAAAEAGRVLACAEQLTLLTRVLELWPSVPDAERLTGTSQAHVLQQADEAAAVTGKRLPGARAPHAPQAARATQEAGATQVTWPL